MINFIVLIQFSKIEREWMAVAEVFSSRDIVPTRALYRTKQQFRCNQYKIEPKSYFSNSIHTYSLSIC